MHKNKHINTKILKEMISLNNVSKIITHINNIYSNINFDSIKKIKEDETFINLLYKTKKLNLILIALEPHIQSNKSPQTYIIYEKLSIIISNISQILSELINEINLYDENCTMLKLETNNLYYDILKKNKIINDESGYECSVKYDIEDEHKLINISHNKYIIGCSDKLYNILSYLYELYGLITKKIKDLQDLEEYSTCEIPKF